MKEPKIISDEETRLSPWVSLVARTIQHDFHPPQTYHSFNLADYVAILCVTDQGRIPCVRQYRPARKVFTLELPAGIVEPGEDPAQTAERELFEETGFRISKKPRLLGKLNADTGRLGNDFWCYFTEGATWDPSWKMEEGVEVVLFTRHEFRAAIDQGEFKNAMHLALLSKAILSGDFQLGGGR